MRILYIDIDALRPDHLGCYGYHRNTSPTIDALAKEGVRFDNFHCSDAPCLPSRTAMYTGMFGIHSGVVGHGGTAADIRVQGPTRSFKDRIEENCLPMQLQKAGYHTAQISPFGQRHAARQFYAGFNEIHNTGRGGQESAEEVTPLVKKWIRDNAEKDNWFLHLNYWDAHTPYRVPSDYPNPFEEEAAAPWISEEILAEHRSLPRPHGARELGMFSDRINCFYPRDLGELKNLDDLKAWFDGYDTAIRYVDDQLSELFAMLKERGLYDDMAIIVSADHGENQGELGIYGEHGTADNVTTRIPYIIKWPGKGQGSVHKGLQYNVDMAPTVAELLGLESPKIWDGESFAEALEGQADGREYLVVSQCAHVCQRGVRFGPWMYIRTIHCGYNDFPEEMLFNVEEDPHEQFDMAKENPAVCAQGLRYLMEWLEEQMRVMPYDNDPLWTVMKEGGPFHSRGKLKEFCERLEGTGRAESAAALRQRYPEEYEHSQDMWKVTY